MSSVGYSQNKTHPFQYKYNEFIEYTISNPRIHAEMDTIVKLRHMDLSQLNDLTIYVYRKGGDGRVKISKPCNACMNAIRDVGITQVVYTILDGIQELII